ncbi:MAG: type VI secretion system protein ImpK [Flavobacteriales bacterium]|jgi:type VI secretion system protein ImpK
MDDNDRTVMVPRPGARGSKPKLNAGRAPDIPSPVQIGEIEISKGLNPLVGAASTILRLAVRLRVTLSHDNVAGLHKQVCAEIKNFETTAKLKKEGLSPESILSARYLLCSVVDEVVLNTPWGANSGWSQRSLLSIFHNETFGGEKTFVLLQRMLETPGSNLEALELFYICLSIGFEGKYRLDSRGHEQIERIRDNLYHTIESHREEFEPDLSSKWQGQATKKNRLMQYIPFWVVASCVCAILLFSYSGFSYWLSEITNPTVVKLSTMLTPDSESEKQPTE